MNAFVDENPQLRVSSRIRRCVHDGVAVYEKKYTTDDWGGTEDVIRKRSEREYALLQDLHASQLFRGRFGIVRVASYDPQQVTIATREVQGMPLGDWLRSSAAHRRLLLPWYLAGAWLRIFQSLPVPGHIRGLISENDPPSLIDYCDLRLRSLRDMGYRWPSDSTHRSLIRVLESLASTDCEWSSRQVLVHADYAPGNLIWGRGILTPIDFAMARMGGPLDDATYLIHRLEMYCVYRPWMHLPVASYRQAILRGLGCADADTSPSYQALMLRHLICRLHTYVRRAPRHLRQSIHDRWVRGAIRKKLKRIAAEFGGGSDE